MNSALLHASRNRLHNAQAIPWLEREVKAIQPLDVVIIVKDEDMLALLPRIVVEVAAQQRVFLHQAGKSISQRRSLKGKTGLLFRAITQ